MTSHAPTYLDSGDPALADYYPAWLDNLADGATLEGSLLDGDVQGAEDVRSIVVTIRSLYDHQKRQFAGSYGDHGFLEEYIAQVRGAPIGCVVPVSHNAAGRAQRVEVGERPRSSLLLLSRLLRVQFAGTPFGVQFAAGKP
jgi:hypothetical protein